MASACTAAVYIFQYFVASARTAAVYILDTNQLEKVKCIVLGILYNSSHIATSVFPCISVVVFRVSVLSCYRVFYQTFKFRPNSVLYFPSRGVETVLLWKLA